MGNVLFLAHHADDEGGQLMAVNCGPYRKMTQGISTHGPIGGPDISTTNYADKRIVQTCRMGNVLFLAHHDGGH